MAVFVKGAKRLLPLFLPFGFIGLGSMAKADHIQQAQAQKPAIEVSIAVPEEDGQRIVRLSMADPHIDVVIHNISNQPLDFYTEDCSMGYNTLHLEVLAIDDRTLPKPINVERSISNWYSNSIRTVTLEPGAVMVREVHFTADHSFMGYRYWNFPAMNAGESHKIRMRAVFEFEPGGGFLMHFHRIRAAAVSPIAIQSKGKVSPSLWSGNIVSDTNDYQIQQYSP